MRSNRFAMGIAIGARQCYLPFTVRVRQWGGLPAGRGPTVLITNHQYEDEGEIVISRVFLTHPWKQLVMVNSRRTFETGFFAARMPWTAPFMRNVNPTRMWEAFSILPVENHLFSRTLLSLAAEFREVHGDLTLETILPDQRVAELELAGQTLDTLWETRNFFKGQQVVKLAHLREPYRHEALERARATAAADVARIVETIRDGATFYVTPEGDFSRDGTMKRLRGGILDAVLPFATPFLCAIAYDPFRGQRLGMLYRILRPADLGDLTASLASARPVTATALVATALLDRGGSIDRATAVADVAARLRAFPSNVFVDPEVASDVDAAVAEALDGAARAGTLRRDGAAYAMSGSHVDPRFPHITDMLAYQRNMLNETVAAAERLLTVRAPQTP